MSYNAEGLWAKQMKAFEPPAHCRAETGHGAVDHPAHYRADTGHEAIDVIEAWGLGFSLGNAVKYIARAGLKGDAVEEWRNERREEADYLW